MASIWNAALALSFALTTTGALAMSHPVTLAVGGDTLHGTLELPENLKAAVPVALLISGSGPTDRDGNSAVLPGANNGLKELAIQLAAYGVASVRYDKRGVGASQALAASVMADSAAAFNAEVSDAAAWIKQLKGDKRFAGVAVLGHSQGSLTGMLAMQTEPAAAFVSLEGAGESIYQTLKRQSALQLPADLMAKVQFVIDELRAGRTVGTLPAEVQAVPAIAGTFAPVNQAYLIEWMKHDPAAVLARVPAPALIVYGTHDDRLTPADRDNLVKAKPDVQAATIAGMAHTLKKAEMTQESQIKAYTDPSVPLAEGLADAVAAFLKASIK